MSGKKNMGVILLNNLESLALHVIGQENVLLWMLDAAKL